MSNVFPLTWTNRKADHPMLQAARRLLWTSSIGEEVLLVEERQHRPFLDLAHPEPHLWSGFSSSPIALYQLRLQTQPQSASSLSTAPWALLQSCKCHSSHSPSACRHTLQRHKGPQGSISMQQSEMFHTLNLSPSLHTSWQGWGENCWVDWFQARAVFPHMQY